MAVKEVYFPTRLMSNIIEFSYDEYRTLLSNVKIERVWQRQYANPAEAKADISDYNGGFSNGKRINSAFGNLPPTGYERKMAARESIVVSEIT
jgi:hypothetical protein